MKPYTLRLPAALLGLLLGLALLPRMAEAITVEPPSFSLLVEKAESVVRGTVVDQESRWVVNDAGHRVIKTFVTLRVDEELKGEPQGGKLVLTFLGGTVGNQTMSIAGMPTFRKGQDGWFFVSGNGRNLCPLAYAQHGAYLAVSDTATGQERVVRLNGAPLTDLAQVADADDQHHSPAPAGTTAVPNLTHALTAAEFSAAIVRENLAIAARQSEVK